MPLPPFVLDKSGKGPDKWEWKKTAKKAVLIKKVRFLIKGGCNSFRKVGIVAENCSSWHAIFSGPGIELGSKGSKGVPVFLEYEGPSLEGIERGGEVEDRWPASSGRAVGLPLTVASFIHCGGSRCAA